MSRIENAAVERRRQSDADLAALLPPMLPGFLRPRRWFAGKARTIAATALEDVAWLPDESLDVALAVVRVEYARGDPEWYALLLALVDRPGELPVIGVVEGHSERRVLVEAATAPAAVRALVTEFAAASGGPAGIPTRNGARVRYGDAATGTITDADLAPGGIRPLAGEQSNSSIRIGERLVLKLFRALADGENPEVEMSRFLTAAGFTDAPALRGSVAYEAPGGAVRTLAVLQEWRDNRGDGWKYVVDALGAGDTARAALAHDLRVLGVTTAELHGALASDPCTAAFAPEAISDADRGSWTAGLRARLERVARRLREAEGFAESARSVEPARGAERVGDLIAALSAAPTRALAAAPPGGFAKIRIHGDFHLGQTLRTDDGFVVIDFEGEPARPLAERRAKHCALKDVAGMLRSFDYAVETAQAPRALEATLRDALLDGYFARAGDMAFLPRERAARAAWIDFFELEKALYEVEYELDHRPDWIHIPLRGVRRIVEKRG